MKTLKKLVFVLAIIAFTIVTPSCKKDSNENPNGNTNTNTTPTSLNVVLAFAFSDAYCALSNADVVIVNQNGDTIVEQLSTSMQDIVTSGKKVNLYTKTINITKFPATLKFIPRMTAKDLHGNYDPTYFEGEGENLCVKELCAGFSCGNDVSQVSSQMTLNISTGTMYSGFPTHLENIIKKMTRTIRIDENGNIIK